MTSYQCFTELFQHTFDHSPDGREAGDQLLTLTQRARRVSDYALEFRTTTAVLKAVFRLGLHPEMLTELACRDEQLTLDSLIGLAIRLDHLLKNRSLPIQEKLSTNISMPVETMQVVDACLSTSASPAAVQTTTLGCSHSMWAPGGPLAGLPVPACTQ